MFKFERLDAWKVSLQLYRKIAAVTTKLKGRDQHFSADQIRRAGLSVIANIAEGTGREGIKESKQFSNIAKGSVYEVVSIAHVLKEEGFIQAEEFTTAYQLCDRIAGMLSGLISKR